jgi:hypothetical protein
MRFSLPENGIFEGGKWHFSRRIMAFSPSGNGIFFDKKQR